MANSIPPVVVRIDGKEWVLPLEVTFRTVLVSLREKRPHAFQPLATCTCTAKRRKGAGPFCTLFNEKVATLAVFLNSQLVVVYQAYSTDINGC